MTTDVLQRKFKEYIQKNSGEWILKTTANLGNYDNVVETGTPGLVYARLSNGQVVTVWNQIAPSIFDTHVEIGISKEMPGIWQVTKVRETYVNPSSGYIVSHAAQHGFDGFDTIWIDRRQIVQMTILVSDSANFLIRVYSSIAPTKAGHVVLETDVNLGYKTIDVSSYVPTSGAKYVGVVYNDSGILSIIEGSVFASPSAGTAADIPVSAYNQYIIGVILLYESQPELPERSRKGSG